ncbi:hypothetical protein [Pseudomonas syringae]|uniref:hypothetical protein n=1 Tax=Pseudomonas syringae TaxID=317 RepID=UPI00190F8305|nr:hypothetical protein [Pseudomonas syringae]
MVSGETGVVGTGKAAANDASFDSIQALGASKAAVTGETVSTSLGKQVHKEQADIRRESGLFSIVEQPIVDKLGNPILVPKRVVLKTGEAQPGANLQKAIPDAANEPPDGILQARIDKAVLPEWPGGAKSPIDTTFEIKIPAGTRVYVGEVGSQGGFYIGGTQQIVVQKPWLIEGVKVINSSPLK